MFATHDDHDDALALCWHHRDLLDGADYLACNEVARSWTNKQPVSGANYARFKVKLAAARDLVQRGERYWCSCGCKDGAGRARHEPEVARRKNAQQVEQDRILAKLPTAEVDAWIIANMGYTAESLAALAKSTRRDRRREARKAMMS